MLEQVVNTTTIFALDWHGSTGVARVRTGWDEAGGWAAWAARVVSVRRGLAVSRRGTLLRLGLCLPVSLWAAAFTASHPVFAQSTFSQDSVSQGTGARGVLAQEMPQPSVRKPPGGGAWSAEVRPNGKAPARVTVRAIRVTGDAVRTQVRMEVDRSVSANMFTLDEPYRAVVDAADLEFRVPPGTGSSGVGLVRSFRYGQFEAGRARVVIDLGGPAIIQNALFTPPKGREPGVLAFDLVRVEAATFRTMRGTAEGPEAPAANPALRGGRHDHHAPLPASPAVKPRPVVMIDPGHGGIDPGAVAAGGMTEKAVTLAVALQVRSLLQQTGRYDVRLTRSSDVFVSLDQRVRASRSAGADLFVSIHADALAEKAQAEAVQGATVYVMSENASDETARRLEEKENAADVLAGLAAVPASAEDQVRSILLDLVQRETANYSAAFRGLLLGQMRGRVPLSREPQRSAAFKVLRQPEVPAVLVELGYMSNSQDLARLGKAEGQRQLAASISAAVDAFFAKRGVELAR
jgi:N-acetylmuramoyl-L-alanine amidase